MLTYKLLSKNALDAQPRHLSINIFSLFCMDAHNCTTSTASLGNKHNLTLSNTSLNKNINLIISYNTLPHSQLPTYTSEYRT